MNAQPSANRTSLGIAGITRSGGFPVRESRAALELVWRSPHAGAAGIERLVLAASSEEGSAALASRAQLIANGIHPTPDVMIPERTDDLPAITEASDLVLVDRRKPMPFIVPYLGRAARGLLRKSAAPMLVVAGMPGVSYSRVVIATDLQTDVTGALAAVNAIAPDASLTLLHVYHALFDGKLQWAGVPETDIARYRVDAQREAALGMAALLDRHPTMRGSRTLLRYGWPVPGVLRTAAELEADLIVVVRKSQSWWADVLGASVSHDVAQRADRDVLIVRAPVYSPGDRPR